MFNAICIGLFMMIVLGVPPFISLFFGICVYIHNTNKNCNCNY